MKRVLIALAFLISTLPSVALASESTNQIKIDFDSIVVKIHDTAKLSKTDQLPELERLNRELEDLYTLAETSEVSIAQREILVDGFSYISKAQEHIVTGNDQDAGNDQNLVFVELSSDELAAATSLQ